VQVRTADERAIATQAKLEALQEEHEKIKADLEFEKEAASEVGGTPFGQILRRFYSGKLPRDHMRRHRRISTFGSVVVSCGGEGIC